jgi:hypothetical protein
MNKYKLIALFVAALALSGCGIPKQVAKDCGGDLELGCKQIFGDTEAETEAEASQDRRLDDIESALAAQFKTNVSLVNQMQSNYNVLHLAISGLSSTDASLQAQLNALQASMVTVQAQANNVQAQLSTTESIVDYLDCNGDNPGFDEVVLRTKSGKLIAYFETGSKRFLSVLIPGSYQTSDASSCPFTVNANMQFCDSISCR